MNRSTEPSPPTPAGSYTTREYVGRLAWEWVQRLLIAPSPRRAYGWRRWWLRRFGARLTGSAGIRPSTRIVCPWLLTMEDGTILGDRVRVYNLGPVTVGRGTTVSQDVDLCGGTHDHTDPAMPLVRSSITIGPGVWVCARAFIGPGVTVGDRSIVGACAVVMKNVPAGVIVAGNPAKVIRQRLTPGSGDGPHA